MLSFLLGISLTINVLMIASYKMTQEKLKKDIDKFKENYKG